MKNLVRKIFYGNDTFTVPAGVRKVAVKLYDTAPTKLAAGSGSSFAIDDLERLYS